MIEITVKNYDCLETTPAGVQVEVRLVDTTVSAAGRFSAWQSPKNSQEFTS